MEERSAFPPPGPSTSQLPAHQVERRLSHREEIKYCFKSKRVFSMVRKETDDGPWDSVNDFYLLMTMMGKGHGNKTLISAKGVKRPLKSPGGCFAPVRMQAQVTITQDMFQWNKPLSLSL